MRYNKSMPRKENSKIEWPKEKLVHYGAGKLSKSELLAILLHAGVNKIDVVELAKNILRKHPKFSLADVSAEELREEFGIQNDKACEIIACFELGRRMAQDKNSPGLDRTSID